MMETTQTARCSGWLRMSGLVAALVLAGLLTSCAASYRYRVVSFDRSPGTVVGEGAGKPAACQALFEPPGAYTGPAIAIPDDATVFGTLIVTRGSDLKALPLFTWKDEAGVDAFGCNGPSPQFAHRSDSREGLADSIGRILGTGSRAK